MSKLPGWCYGKIKSSNNYVKNCDSNYLVASDGIAYE